jgi:hypothetical protein
MFKLFNPFKRLFRSSLCVPFVGLPACLPMGRLANGLVIFRRKTIHIFWWYLYCFDCVVCFQIVDLIFCVIFFMKFWTSSSVRKNERCAPSLGWIQWFSKKEPVGKGRLYGILPITPKLENNMTPAQSDLPFLNTRNWLGKKIMHWNVPAM